jgi:hypothetical protein
MLQDNTELIHDSLKDLFEEIATPTQDRAPQSSTASINNTSDAPTEIVNEEIKEPTPEISAEMLDSSADLTIGLLDFGQSSMFTWVVNRKKNKKLIQLYGENAIDKLEHLINEQDAEANNKIAQKILREFSADEMGMLRLARRVNEITEDLPMTDTEKELIKVPLMALMKEKGGTLSPQWALTIAVLQIFGSRAMQTINI